MSIKILSSTSFSMDDVCDDNFDYDDNDDGGIKPMDISDDECDTQSLFDQFDRFDRSQSTPQNIYNNDIDDISDDELLLKLNEHFNHFNDNANIISDNRRITHNPKLVIPIEDDDDYEDGVSNNIDPPEVIKGRRIVKAKRRGQQVSFFQQN